MFTSHVRAPRRALLSVVCLITYCAIAANAFAVFDKRFDVCSFNCTPDGSEDHFCQPQFDHLNWVSTNGHMLAMGTDAHRAEINANGNFLGAYYDTLTDLYGSTTGTQAADMIEQYVIDRFTVTGVKTKWLLLNEISSGLWPDTPAYRAWLRTAVARLHDVYGHEVILFAPFQTVAQNGADWVPLSQNCYIAIECFLSGAEVNSHGNSVSWCQTQYQTSKNSYIARGIAA
ncbi:MAG TPA: hypothetical protein VL282_16230, partial [Tepidisphaeraceae bacterium]|nr:hypothetical protein [Tepidisphaeraceae bacterium]